VSFDPNREITDPSKILVQLLGQRWVDKLKIERQCEQSLQSFSVEFSILITLLLNSHEPHEFSLIKWKKGK